MTLHPLTAGDGYTYLTRQVAAHDETLERQGLSEYYAASGNPAGRWTGAGLAGLMTVAAGSQVSQSQMENLFGEGAHPDDADQILGRRFFRFRSVAERVAERTAALPAGMPAVERAAAVAGIEAAEIAKGVREPVAGYDLVFSPVKSVSTLWAVADPGMREQIEAAHTAAWTQTLAWLESDVAHTRVGANGIEQVKTHGLIAAAFDHRDSRLGDPDLHTHVAVSTKVQARSDDPGVDGKWLTLDSQALHHAAVSASERYNTLLEVEIGARLGFVFEARAAVDSLGRDAGGKVAVRELAGVPVELNQAWSKRRGQVESRLAEKILTFQSKAGKMPSKAQQLALADEAVVELRPGKKAGRPFREQLADWDTEARTVLKLDPEQDVAAGIIARAREASADRSAGERPPTGRQLGEVRESVMAALLERRSTWTEHHVRAEVLRAVRHHGLAGTSPAEVGQVTEQLVASVLAPGSSLSLGAPERANVPELHRREDGTSGFIRHGTTRFTSTRILEAEGRLVDAALRGRGPVGSRACVESVLEDCRASGKWSEEQSTAVRELIGSGRQLDLLVAAAGAGKTTALTAVVAAWVDSGLPVVGLAPSAAAAKVLASETRIRAETVAKFLHPVNAAGSTGEEFQLRAGHLVIVDEAGMTGTLALDDLRARVDAAGAKLLLVGDPAQLAAVEAGGALRLLEHELAGAGGGARLAELHRFQTAWEPAATLRLRDGDTTVLDLYADAGRVHGGSRVTVAEQAYTDWQADVAQGKTSLLIASTNDAVLTFNERARADRVTAGQVDDERTVTGKDGSRIGVGDQIVTRRNERKITARGGQDFVRNGDIWTVEKVKEDGELICRSARHEGTVTLPGAYVTEHVQLGYATTVHRAQGATVDVSRSLVAPEETREGLYVAATRGREANHLYVITSELPDVEVDHKPTQDRSARDVLITVMGRTTEQVSATETLREALTEGASVRTLLPQYVHVAQADAGQQTLKAAVNRLPSELAGRLPADPALPELARALTRARTASADAGDPIEASARLLRAAAASREIPDSGSAALVLAYRLDQMAGAPPALPPTEHLSVSELLLGPAFVRDAEATTTDPATCEYLRDIRQLVDERAEQLGTAALAAPFSLPSQLPVAMLGQPPAGPLERQEWVRAVGLVLAWQERHAPDGVETRRAVTLAEPRNTRDRDGHAAVTVEVDRVRDGLRRAEPQPDKLAEALATVRERAVTRTGPDRAGRDRAAEQRDQAARESSQEGFSR